MQVDVYTCSINDTLNRAAQIMWDHDCGSVPVVDEDERVVGMLTDRDVCMAAFTTDLPLSRASVNNAMSKTVFACAPDASLAYAEELMRRHQVRRLPVIDAGGALVGILSLGDIARRLGDRPVVEADVVSSDALAETLAAISQIRHAKKLTA
jgi:CBS domain-containing protein